MVRITDHTCATSHGRMPCLDNPEKGNGNALAVQTTKTGMKNGGTVVFFTFMDAWTCCMLWIAGSTLRSESTVREVKTKLNQESCYSRDGRNARTPPHLF